MAEEKTQLKPCPFCGDSHLQLKHGPSFNPQFKGDSRFDHWWVACRTCGTDGPYVATANLAIENWNIRVDDALRAQRDELLAALKTMRDALLWCGGSNDFVPKGRAWMGWNTEVVPALKKADEAIAKAGGAS